MSDYQVIFTNYSTVDALTASRRRLGDRGRRLYDPSSLCPADVACCHIGTVVSQSDFNALIAESSLEGCSGVVYVFLSFTGWAAPLIEPVGSIVEIYNTQLTQGFGAEADVPVTIGGIGFASTNLSAYSLTFGATGCTAEADSYSAVVYPDSRTDSYTLLATVDFSGCTGVVSAQLAYGGYATLASGHPSRHSRPPPRTLPRFRASGPQPQLLVGI